MVFVRLRVFAHGIAAARAPGARATNPPVTHRWQGEAPQPPCRGQGWTLVELLAVSAIIAILSGYAWVGYHRYLQHGYRLAAVMTLYRAAAHVAQAAIQASPDDAANQRAAPSAGLARYALPGPAREARHGDEPYQDPGAAAMPGHTGERDARSLPPSLARVPEFGRPVYRIVWKMSGVEPAAYTLEAEPEPGGPLGDDEMCGTYVLDSAGRRANRIHGRLTNDVLIPCWPPG